MRDMAEKIIFLYHPCVKNPKCPIRDRFGMFFQQPRPVRCQRLLQIMEARGGEAVHIDFNVCQQLRKFFMGDKLTQQPIIDAAAFQKLHRRVTQAKLRQGSVWKGPVFRPTEQVINGHLIEVCQSDKVFVIHFSWRVQFIAAEGGF